MVKSDLPEKELRAIDAALDRLVTDPSPLVRAAVARYGRPIDRQKLQVDPSPLVRAQARRN
ncbi:hypothetical protein EFM15_01335 [Lactobacillus delbrueckii]|nr:hypothetical protein [Lactobacillus delbrueckii]